MRRGLLPAGLCSALALVTAVAFSGCLNPRPEEDPSAASGGVDLPDDSQGSNGGAGGSGAGGDLNVDPDEEEVAPPPASESDAGAPRDGGVEAADAGSGSDAAAD
jgi:hypothetical protein